GHTRKVKSDNVFTERISRNVLAKKVFIPNLQKGSIIEYRYKMRSDDFLSLYDWYFQEEIPIRWSELNLYSSDNLQYVAVANTTRLFVLKDSLENIQKGNYLFYSKRWAMANVPALKEEPFITSIDEYRNFIRFNLRSYSISRYVRYPVSASWKQIARDLEKITEFGGQYNRIENFQRLWTAFEPQLAAEDSTVQKSEKALRFVTTHMKWDGSYQILPESNLDSAFLKKTGSSSELNLALVALLRKAGVKVYPLLLSTRDNGAMYRNQTFIPQFNSLVAVVKQDSTTAFVLDATDPYLPINHLQSLHYHGSGWMLDPKNPAWLNISAPESAHSWYGKMTLGDDGVLSGSFQMQVTGNIASEWRAELDTVKTVELLRKKFAVRHTDITFDSIVFSQLRDISQPLSVRFSCKVSGASQAVNDFIYLQPVVDFFILDNPFKSLQRELPISFVTPFKAQYVMDIALPEGYVIEELPPPARINLPDNAGKMSFSCSKNAHGVLQVNLRMNLAQTDFKASEYGALRQFFELVVEKTQTQLVLKKA
ncbi:MAG: hypothetical protein JNM22_10860, partial [Saprospiraceae bacterium]|nr:hypothetical protein [Saprospiraceae bacterium]